MGCGGSKPEEPDANIKGDEESKSGFEPSAGSPPVPQAQDVPEAGTVAAKAEYLQVQLGIPTGTSLSQTVSTAGRMLGIESSLADAPTLVMKLDVCISHISGTAHVAAPPHPPEEPAIEIQTAQVHLDEAVKSRALDAILEDGGMRNPLGGMFPPTLPLPSLQTALAEIGKKHPHLEPAHGRTVKMARAKAKSVKPEAKGAMSDDEVVAVVIYTMEETPREQSLYYLMNQALLSMQRDGVREWRDFIWLLLHAMKKIPMTKERSVYRGLKFEPGYAGKKPNLTVGHEVTWSAFSSTATTINVMQDFVGTLGERILYDIELTEPVARTFKAFSFFPNENELVLPPNFTFKIVAINNFGGGLTMVQCLQTETLDVLLDFGASPAEWNVSVQRMEISEQQRNVADEVDLQAKIREAEQRMRDAEAKARLQEAEMQARAAEQALALKSRHAALENALRDAMPGWFGIWTERSTATLQTAIAQAEAAFPPEGSSLHAALLEAKAALRSRAEAKARKEAEERARREAEEKARREVEEKARREAVERSARETAEERSRREAEAERARREAAEKARAEKARQAAAQRNRLKLVLQDGRGIALEHHSVDATHERHAHFMRMASAAEAIEVEFDARGCVMVVAGHHIVRQHCLDNWGGAPNLGNRQHFSTWAQTHSTHPSQQWTFNSSDCTISPKNAGHLCLGWQSHAQLVSRGDHAALKFKAPDAVIDNSNKVPWSGPQWSAAILIGRTVALRNPATNRWIRVTSDGDANCPSMGSWNGAWQWERFRVHDCGDGQIALYNPATNRWLRVTGDDRRYAPRGPGLCNSPSQGKWQSWWGWERFEVHNLGSGIIGLKNRQTQRWPRCTDTGDVNSPAVGSFNPGWQGERFEVKILRMGGCG